MGNPDKFRIVVAAIENARAKDPSSGLVEVRQTKENKLNTIPINKILNILRDLELGAGVIKIIKENRPEKKEEPWPQLWDPQKVRESIYNSGISFTIEVLGTYEEWFVNYANDLVSGQKPLSPRETSGKPALKLPVDAKWEDRSF